MMHTRNLIPVLDGVLGGLFGRPDGSSCRTRRARCVDRGDFAQLERRILFSAAPLMDAPIPDPHVLGDDAIESALTNDVASHSFDDASDDTMNWDPHEIVLLDTSVDGYQNLLVNLEQHHDYEVVLLDGQTSGIDQVTELLSRRESISAIHIVSHGAEGAIRLGGDWLELVDLDRHSADWAIWRSALTDGGDVLFYGCDVASTDQGRAFVDAFAYHCDCDVAASDDATGSKRFDGDWELEYAAGVIETDLAIPPAFQASWVVALQSKSYADDFSSNGYTNSSGTEDWSSTPWTEFGENNGPGLGKVMLKSAFGTNAIGMRQDGNGIARAVDLSGSSHALLDFDYAVSAFDNASDYFLVEISSNGGSTWAELARVSGPHTSSQLESMSLDISDYANANTVIRFVNEGNAGSDESFLANVRIHFSPDIIATNETTVNTPNSLVDTTAAADRGSQHAVALAADGSYTVTWSREDSLTGWDVLARRYDRLGNALTGEILVHTATGGDQQWARVASDERGNFAITWTDGSSGSQDIWARSFHADGTPIQTEYVVNSTTAGDQLNSSIDLDREGHLIVVWQGAGPGDADDGIFFRRFHLDGTPVDTTDSLVNAQDRGNESGADVTMREDGSFVVVWEATDNQVYAQRFDTAGDSLGGEIRITAVAGRSPAIDADANGDFTIVYRTDAPLIGGIWGQDYSADGTARSPRFRAAGGSSESPSIAKAADGSFLVTYHDAVDGSGNAVLARRYTTNAVPIEAAFRVNTTTLGEQRFASADVLDIENYVIAWSGAGAVDSESVLVRQYGAFTQPKLLLATRDDVASGSGAPGVESWFDHQALGFGGADFSLGVGANTRGELSVVFDLVAFGPSVAIDGMHFVRSNLSLGDSALGTQFDVQPGDLLLTVANGAGHTFVGETTTVTVDPEDVFVFRPLHTGDYQRGDFFLLLDNPLNDDIRGLALVESHGLVIGDGPPLPQGTFLFSEKGGGDHDNVYTYLADRVGVLTSSTLGRQLLLDGEDSGGLNFSDQIQGIHVVEENMTLGGLVFEVGDLLLTLNTNVTNIGSGSTTIDAMDQDIFRIRLSETVMGPNSRSVGSADLVFDGSALGLDSNSEGLSALTLVATGTSLPANVAPTLSLDIQVTTLPENTDTSFATTIADIVINDDGLGTNVLALTGPDQASFEILGNHLRLLPGVSLDFETQSTLQVGVSVSDTAVGSNPDDQVTLTISITDVNESPSINLSQSLFSVAEDVASSLTVASISITDDALGSYTISLVGPDASRFQLIGTDLQLTGPLDFETNSVLDVSVEVNDPSISGSPDASVALSVDVSNVNEPVTDIVLDNNMLSEGTNTTGGTVVGRLTSVDDDSPESFVYTITGGTDAAFFSVGGTGSDELILTHGILDAESKPSYSVAVTSSDTAGNSRQETFFVNVIDINEPPSISLTQTQFSVMEDTTAVLTIGTFSITDDALGSYTVSLGGPDASLFQLNGTDLQLVGPLDYETNSVLDVSIDVNDPSITGYPDASVSMSINVLNASEPITDIMLDNSTLSEGTDTTGGFVVGRLSSIDDDSPEWFLYSISGGVDAALFSIGGMGNDELILTHGVLDTESKPSYSVAVTSTDSTGNSRQESFVVTVANVNEAPTISSISNQVIVSAGMVGPLPFSVSDPETLSATLSVTAFTSDQQAIPNANVTLSHGTSRWVSLDPVFSEFDSPVTVTLVVSDGVNQTQTSFSVMWAPPNNPPHAKADTFFTVTNNVLNVTSQSVLANDQDVDGDSLVATLVTGPANGALSFEPNGTFQYIPESGFAGTDTFTYRASDGEAVSNVAEVTIRVQSAPPTSGRPVAPPPTENPLPEPEVELPPEGDTTDNGDSNPGTGGPPVTAPETGTNTPRTSGQTTSDSATPASLALELVVDVMEKKERDSDSLSHHVAATLSFSSRSREINSGVSRVEMDDTRASRTLSDTMLSVVDAVYSSQLDQVSDEINSASFGQRIAVGEVASVVSSLSVGYVVWILRGGYLLTSLLTQMPAWRLVDPLPIMDLLHSDDDGEDHESLQSLVDQGDASRSADLEASGAMKHGERETPAQTIVSDRDNPVSVMEVPSR